MLESYDYSGLVRVPENWEGAEQIVLETPDGVSLFTRHWPVQNPVSVCILVHGLGEHGGRYERLAEALTRQGHEVRTMDHRGHGRSGGRRSDCVSLDRFVDDLDLLVKQAALESPALPIALIGHSLGGLIALAYAARFPERLRAVAVSSPALGIAVPIPKPKTAVAHLLARIAPTIPIPNGINPEWLSRDPQIVAAYRADPLVNGDLTARCAVLLERAIPDSISLAERLRVPCLILQAGDDRICDAQASQRFALAVRQAPVTFRRYDGLYHELFNEPERERVIEDLCRWLKETFS